MAARKPRIISDNGPQFIARDFKEFIRIAGMTHVRTSPGYPQSNGKLERWHKSLKSECIRPGIPLTREDALRLIHTYVKHYNTVRLHSAIGYVTPHDMLAGRAAEIHAARDCKLEQARREREVRRRSSSPMFSRLPFAATMTPSSEMSNSDKVKIYVRLIDEGADVSRPTEALDLGNGLLELLPTPDYDSEDETWEFRPGSVVRCEKRQGGSGEYLLAVRA